jgi:hypothetical protein
MTVAVVVKRQEWRRLPLGALHPMAMDELFGLVLSAENMSADAQANVSDGAETVSADAQKICQCSSGVFQYRKL